MQLETIPEDVPLDDQTLAPGPIVKWVGGKGRLIAQMRPFLPQEFATYYEPFCGGAAVFFALQPKVAQLNDRNRHLIQLYTDIKSNVADLIENLKRLQKHYDDATQEDREIFYYKVRTRFNAQAKPGVEKSAFLIFLNKTCYNGLFRENARGEFNSPFGRYERPRILDIPGLWAAHRALQGVTLSTVSFEDAVINVKAGDFVYFDPPYHPLNGTSRFTNYTGTDFREADQHKLHRIFQELDKRGALLMLSNSHTPFIQELYAGYDHQTIMAGRAVNSKTTGRGKIPELIIRNYTSILPDTNQPQSLWSEPASQATE